MDTVGLRIELLLAAYKGDLEKFTSFAKKVDDEFGEGAAKTTKDVDNQTALHLAAIAGKHDMCKYLIDNMKLDVNAVDVDGNTPLHRAVLAKDHQTATYLLQNGADANKINNKGCAPLHHAAEKDSTELMQLLVSKGGDVHLCARFGTPLHIAAALGSEEAVDFLLQNNADPNSVSPQKFSPLILSYRTQSFESMELLLKAGANPNVGLRDRTPLSTAACNKDMEVINLLLKHGADPDMKDDSGRKALEYAALADYLDGVRILFPVTARISSFPCWSISGIMEHLNSNEARTERELNRKEECQMAWRKGKDAFNRKDYNDAVSWYSLALNIEPINTTLLYERSMCWFHLEIFDLALEDAAFCVGLNPKCPMAHHRTGASWRSLKNYKMAFTAFETALSLDPANKESHQAMREMLDELSRSVLLPFLL